MDQPVTTAVPFDGTTLANAIAGPLTSVLISALVSKDASPRYKAIMTLIVCFLVQLLVTVIGKTFVGSWSPNLADNIWLVAVNFAVCFATAFGAYQAITKPTGAADALEKDGIGKLGKPE